MAVTKKPKPKPKKADLPRCGTCDKVLLHCVCNDNDLRK